MKRQIREKLGEKLAIPPEVMCSLPLTQLRGRRSVTIENHDGILVYTDTCVRVSVQDGAVNVQGSGLCIARMTRRSVEIRGTICTLTLE